MARGAPAQGRLAWWMVTTTVRLLSDTFLTARMTMAAARASSPLVGSSLRVAGGQGVAPGLRRQLRRPGGGGGLTSR